MRASIAALRPLCRAAAIAQRPLLTASASRSVFAQATTLAHRQSHQRFFISSSAHAQAEVTDAVTSLDETSPETESPKDEKPPITSEYKSLKPYINYDTWKALTSKPFHFEQMSDVQQRVLKLLPQLADPSSGEMPDGEGGRDLLVKAKTGTGKTIAFLVPAIERRLLAIKRAARGQFTEPFAQMLKAQRPDLDFDSLDKHGRLRLQRQFCYNTVGALIISPTRELATQIATEAKKLLTYHDDFGVQLLVGGASRPGQLRQWNRERPDIVVATPGRLIDILNDEKMVSGALAGAQSLIYDEADTLLDMGFRDDIEQILKFMPKPEHRATMLFSATVSDEIRQIARKSLLPDHRFIDCVPKGEKNVHEKVPQFVTVVNDAKDQFAHLGRLIALDQLRNPAASKIIVFCPTKNATKLFAGRFSRSSPMLNTLPAGSATSVYELHSALDSNKRFRVSDMFRSDKRGASILFTSDVSARGVDYPGTTQVIQLGVPSSGDVYIHRVGRTGRAGKTGRADLLLQPFEAEFVRAELSKLPITETTTEALKTEVEDLASTFDKDPESVVPADLLKKMNKPFSRSKVRGMNTDVVNFISPVLPRLVNVNESVETMVQNANKEEVEESFMSFIGYYAGRSREIRRSIPDIADALKNWCVTAADLDRPPYISDQMLAKMGVGFREKPKGKFGSSSRDRDQGGRGSRDGGRFAGRSRSNDRYGRSDRNDRFEGRGGRGDSSRFDGENMSAARKTAIANRAMDRFF